MTPAPMVLDVGHTDRTHTCRLQMSLGLLSEHRNVNDRTQDICSTLAADFGQPDFGLWGETRVGRVCSV